MIRSPQSPASKTRGFTLVELLVSIAIFAIMTTLVMVKYGTFNQSVLLTNLAYDVAVAIRTAQTYGLSVRNTDPSADTASFQYGYGLYFDAGTPYITFFADEDPDNQFDEDDRVISTYTLKRGAIISHFCEGACTPGAEITGVLSITFKRPDPDAHISIDGDPDSSYVEIVILATDGSTRSVVVRSNGQISVKD